MHRRPNDVETELTYRNTYRCVMYHSRVERHFYRDFQVAHRKNQLKFIIIFLHKERD